MDLLGHNAALNLWNISSENTSEIYLLYPKFWNGLKAFSDEKRKYKILSTEKEHEHKHKQI